MPLSVFQGAPWPREGEPLFTQEDHDWFVALAEERRDTCPSCGLLKVVCRDPANQHGVFLVMEEQCHATKVVGEHREAHKDRDKATSDAIQLSIGFREGKNPPLEVGLELADGDAGDGSGGADGAGEVVAD